MIQHADDQFCTWSGFYVSQTDKVVVLCFVALNGYNAVAKYAWKINSEDQEEERFPVLYTKSTGIFECTVIVPGVQAKKEFHIQSEILNTQYFA